MKKRIREVGKRKIHAIAETLTIYSLFMMQQRPQKYISAFHTFSTSQFSCISSLSMCYFHTVIMYQTSFPVYFTTRVVNVNHIGG